MLYVGMIKEDGSFAVDTVWSTINKDSSLKIAFYIEEIGYMRMYDCIVKKKHGMSLGSGEIREMIQGYVNGTIPDYQMAAMLMAIYFQGMNQEELTAFTMEMAKSGDMIDLSRIRGVTVDKHSTGGVGDKTTLILGPIAAACGAKVAKMSGRGLGHTGGTIDKLESIPSLRTNLSQEEFFSIVNKTGFSVAGQSGNLAPADKKLYALRDVTGTVDSIPLIAASIMSKKLAAGSDCILLDVKTGSGAFMKTVDQSLKLAEKMVSIGTLAGRKTMAVITDMDIPLGRAIGNSLEVIEAVETLKGRGPKDLQDICLELASHLLCMGRQGSLEKCRSMAEQAVASGRAFDKLVEMVSAQGGDTAVLLDTGKFEAAPFCREVKALSDGFVYHMDAEKCGIASVMLGAGRETKESAIDVKAGIILAKKTGDAVKKGDVLAHMYASSQMLFKEAGEVLQSAYAIREEKPEAQPLIRSVVH